MNSNFLKLNDSKTEFIIFGTPQDLSKVSGWTVTVGDTEVLPSTSVRNIGAFMDSSLNMVNIGMARCLFILRFLKYIMGTVLVYTIYTISISGNIF